MRKCEWEYESGMEGKMRRRSHEETCGIVNSKGDSGGPSATPRNSTLRVMSRFRSRGSALFWPRGRA